MFLSYIADNRQEAIAIMLCWVIGVNTSSPDKAEYSHMDRYTGT